ncbi:hypothetical protein CERSUDRAFT_49689 [Gelatoporia subvermispora B]|uniref:NmrA-like domain-containing protein n=1 Tax=Ceriporiopsis subvermispora (strain B) TaxID=914234 RepID=M2RG94_CERS8|nr:hypothetical protein CERSUDRAFT_49689 [Gelatoporia subvermispora B]
MLEAFRGVWGAWVNTDGFSIGEEKETFAGIRLFELAKEARTVRHYIWSNLDGALKKANYDPKYHVEHYAGKSRVADWMRAQPSIVSDDEMSWSVVTTGPYMDMLNLPIFGPLKQRADGTFVFVTPIGQGHVPMIALRDLGFFARYTFDHRAEVSGRELEFASDIVGWDHLVDTFRRVTGQKAEVLQQTADKWCDNFNNADKPIANERKQGEGKTWRQNFSNWWNMYRDDIITRDMEWIQKVNPDRWTVEKWMRETGYTGQIKSNLLKNLEEDGAASPNWDIIAEL